MTIATIRTWLGDRSPRERRLLGLAGAATALLLGLLAVRVVGDDLGGLRARIDARERELAQVRSLAARLARAGVVGTAPGDASLLLRLETAATTVLQRDRIASITTGATDADTEHAILRISDASLLETVRLLHALESTTPPLHVARLEMRKHPDASDRLATTVEVASPRTAP